MATVLNNNLNAPDNIAWPRAAVVSYNTVPIIWAYDFCIAPKFPKSTGYDFNFGSSASGLLPGEGQIFPQGVYSFVSDMKQKIVEVDFGGAATYSKVQDITDAEVTSGVSVIAVQVGVAATSRNLDEVEMDMFNIVAAPGVPADGTLRLYISSRMPVSGKYKFGYTIGTL